MTESTFAPKLRGLGFMPATPGFNAAMDMIVALQLMAAGVTPKILDKPEARRILEKMRSEPTFAIIKQRGKTFSYVTDDTGTRWILPGEVDRRELLSLGFTDISETRPHSHKPIHTLN